MFKNIYVIVLGLCVLLINTKSVLGAWREFESEERTNVVYDSGIQVLSLGRQIVCNLNKNPKNYWNVLLVMLEYNKYGCYCGMGGSGTPINAIDQCCKNHDKCYIASQGSLPSFQVFSVVYAAKCNPVTDTSSCESTSNGKLANEICECDRVFAECLKTTRHLYNGRKTCPK